MKIKLILFHFVLLALTTNSVLADTAKLQFSINKHYYQRFDTPATWLNAVSICRSLPNNSHLVTLSTIEENIFVAKMTNSQNWLGESLTKSGDIVSVNGDVSITKVNKNGNGDHFFITPSGSWQRGDDIIALPYVCEWD